MKASRLFLYIGFAAVAWAQPAAGGIKVTGGAPDKTDFATMLTAIMGTTVTIAGDGTLSIAAGGNACAQLLRDAIADTTAVKVAVGRNQDGVAFGSFDGSGAGGQTSGTQTLDLDDLDKLGNDNTTGTFTRGSIIMHEIWEVQFSKKNKKGFRDSHAHAIKNCENGYYAAMTGTPTVRTCGDDVFRDDDSTHVRAYTSMKKGDGTVGWQCVKIEKPGNKWVITEGPTFSPGVDPPQLITGSGSVVALSELGALPGPIESYECPVGRDYSFAQEALVAPTFTSSPATTLIVGSWKFDSGATCTAQGWTTVDLSGAGNYFGLFKKTQANYEEQCVDNLSCYWAAITGSTEFYACGTPPQPAQKVVPHVNVLGQYVANEIWSPNIAYAGTGSRMNLEFSVYRDLPLKNLVFYVWHVRNHYPDGHYDGWKDHGFVYYAEQKDWFRTVQPIGYLLDMSGGSGFQVALGVWDMCPLWCGIYGFGNCHSPAPYFDQVKVKRIDAVGPQWGVRDIDTFNDNFAGNGTTTGTARFDEARDISASTNPAVTPGDSGVVFYVVDPKYVAGTGTNACGLSADPTLSTFIGRDKTKKQVYIYVAVWPLGQPGKSGAPLSEGPGGTANRYPFSGTVVANGVTWTKIRMDYTYEISLFGPGVGTPEQSLVPGRFNVDLNDALFQPCDTIYYFYGATSNDGTTYFSLPWGSTTNISQVAANPMEVTILPAGGWKRGGDILYVDGADGFGVQQYYDGAFQVLDLANKIDRFDVTGPSSAASNRLGGRVIDVQQQLNDCYNKIIWDTGPLSITLGDGSGNPEKTDDYDTINTFLGNLTGEGGVMLLGDRQAQYLISAGGSAVTFRSVYMPFTLINSNHRLAPSSFPISPRVVHWPGRCYTDAFIAFGGCPQLNDFDVIGATGTSQIEMSYNTAASSNGAVLSNINGNANVLMAGFSLAFVRDDELDGISDRAKFLRDSCAWMGIPLPSVTGSDPVLTNTLAQNYPNPFNPQTTITFSLRDRGAVSLKIYSVAGQLVRTLAEEDRVAGHHKVVWDARDNNGVPVSSGVYFYRLVSNGFSQTRKMVLLK